MSTEKKVITFKAVIIKLVQFIFGTATIVFLIGLGMSLSEKHDLEYPWKASIFSTADIATIIDSKDVKTLEECRSWASDRAKALMYKDGEWDYKCGKGCAYRDDKIAGGKEAHVYGCAVLTK